MLLHIFAYCNKIIIFFQLANITPFTPSPPPLLEKSSDKIFPAIISTHILSSFITYTKEKDFVVMFNDKTICDSKI